MGETGASLDGNTYFDRDDEVDVEVVPNDGADDGPAVISGSITILNTASSVSNAVISPAGPTAGDTLTCSYDFSDIDNDSDVSSIEWTVNGTVVSDPSGLAARGDTVGCTVTADDGTDTGNNASTSVTIGNQLPTVSDVSISPSPAGGSDTLTCSYLYVDVDGDADNSTFLWQINGSNAGYTNTLSGGFARNDTVTCIVTPNDGTSTGSSGQDQITIGNAAPVVTSVTITPDPAGMNDVLTCEYTDSDFDGDGVTVSYDWTVNTTSSGTAADLSGPFSSGDVIVCTVTPDDGTDVGNPLSDDLTIGNTAPTISSVTITPDPAIASSTLTCTYAFADADGDGDGGLKHQLERERQRSGDWQYP